MARGFYAVEAARPEFKEGAAAVRASAGRRAGDYVEPMTESLRVSKRPATSATKLDDSLTSLIHSVETTNSPYVFEVVVIGRKYYGDVRVSRMMMQIDTNDLLTFLLTTRKISEHRAISEFLSSQTDIAKEVELANSLCHDAEKIIAHYNKKIKEKQDPIKELKHICSLFNDDKYGKGVLRVIDTIIRIYSAFKDFSSVAKGTIKIVERKSIPDFADERTMAERAAAAGGGGGGGGSAESRADTKRDAKEESQAVGKWLSVYVKGIMKSADDEGKSIDLQESLLSAYRTALSNITSGLVTDIGPDSVVCAEHILKNLIAKLEEKSAISR